MGTCPNCHAKGLLLTTRACNTCAKIGCKNCLIVVGQTARQDGKWDPWASCSWSCFDKWASYQVSTGAEVRAWGATWTFQGVALGPSALDRVNRMIADHRRKWALASAINYLNAERHEDAARIYESLGMHREAGEVRRAGRRQVSTQVQVNVNDLMQQLRAMGVSANYTCPVCRSPTVITAATSPDALAKCRYCGAVTRPTDIVEAITKVLGSR